MHPVSVLFSFKSRTVDCSELWVSHDVFSSFPFFSCSTGHIRSHQVTSVNLSAHAWQFSPASCSTPDDAELFMAGSKGTKGGSGTKMGTSKEPPTCSVEAVVKFPTANDQNEPK